VTWHGGGANCSASVISSRAVSQAYTPVINYTQIIKGERLEGDEYSNLIPWEMIATCAGGRKEAEKKVTGSSSLLGSDFL
jgi:hypothetical protein